MTRTDTLKWHDLKESPQIAICIFHPSYGQIIMEGTAMLNNMINHFEEITSYWDSLPLQFQKIYLQDVHDNAKSITKVPEIFGVISVNVSMCEILSFDKNDYIKSNRERFLILNNSWVKQLVTPV